jgi:hypothetical protein
LNIVVRGRGVRSYLGYYLNLVEDERRGVLENSPLPCHFTTREEEFFEIGAVSFKHLVTLLCQGVEGRLMMLFLSRLDPLVSEFPPFMLDVREVVDSPAESPKVFAHEMNKSRKPLFEIGEIGHSGFRNWTLRFR